jgi:hypothetical protein
MPFIKQVNRINAEPQLKHGIALSTLHAGEGGVVQRLLADVDVAACCGNISFNNGRAAFPLDGIRCFRRSHPLHSSQAREVYSGPRLKADISSGIGLGYATPRNEAKRAST